MCWKVALSNSPAQHHEQEVRFILAVVRSLHLRQQSWLSSIVGWIRFLRDKWRICSLWLMSPVLDAIKHCMGFCQVLLDLLPSIKYWTISRCAEHILMQASLAALTLGPQSAERRLHLIHTKQGLLVYLSFLQKPEGFTSFLPVARLADLTAHRLCMHRVWIAQIHLHSPELTLFLQSLHSVVSPGARVALQLRQL